METPPQGIHDYTVLAHDTMFGRMVFIWLSPAFSLFFIINKFH